MAEPDSSVQPRGRRPGVAVVATLPRWLAVCLALEVGLGAAVQGLLLFTHSAGSVSTFVWPLAVGATAGWLLVFAMLRAEESRLARELRTARTGTPVLRALIARRRLDLPFLARWSSSKLGTAAVLLADGDRDGALDSLKTASVFMRGGRLERLRALVEADLERNTGTSVGLERCVQRLRLVAPIGNREADLYRVHVLVKAVLEHGDGDTAVEIVDDLGASDDDDARVYATWLRVWFDLDEAVQDTPDGDAGARGGEAEAAAHRPPDAGGVGQSDEGSEAPWPALTEGDLRMATLAARAHGAESLVSKLTLRLSAIARAESRG
jgi:hypothetical protein